MEMTRDEGRCPECGAPLPPSEAGDSLCPACLFTLALDRLSAALNLSPKIDKELSALRADVQRHYDFDAGVFAGHLRAFRQKL